MPKITYLDKNFKQATLDLINQANRIIAEYDEQGFSLTVRQLYYQFVARGLIPNTQNDYRKIAAMVSDGRKAGLIDWSAIEDRTRRLEALSHWDDPADIVKRCAETFHIDRWLPQQNRIEVWIEKEALVGVIEGVCEELDVPYFACRGYPSDSEVWRAARRFRRYEAGGQKITIIHLGDHDPSGIDMTRDILDRLTLFQAAVEVDRIALTIAQVEEYGPPPNPAKVTDSRFEGYEAKYGTESWELDALEPKVITDLIRTAVVERRDSGKWSSSCSTEEEYRGQLQDVSDRWDDVVEFTDGN